jgi:hypothetical protein
MSTRHRNAGGPFTIFNPGLGVSGSLKIEQADDQSRAVHVSGSMSIMPKSSNSVGWAVSLRNMLEIIQENQQSQSVPGGITIFGAGHQGGVGDGYASLGLYSGSSSSPTEFVVTSGLSGNYSSHGKTTEIKFLTSGTDNETQRVKISQYPALQVTGSFQNNGNASITGSLDISGQITTPSQPFDSLTRSTNITLSEGSSYSTIGWNAVHTGYTPSGNYNSATGTYTASNSGVYFMVLQVALKDVDANLMSRIQIKVETTPISGTATDSCWINIIPQDLNNVATASNNADAVVRCASAMLSVQAGSTFKVVYRKVGGGSATELLGSTVDGGGSFWQIRFMG